MYYSSFQKDFLSVFFGKYSFFKVLFHNPLAKRTFSSKSSEMKSFEKEYFHAAKWSFLCKWDQVFILYVFVGDDNIRTLFKENGNLTTPLTWWSCPPFQWSELHPNIFSSFIGNNVCSYLIKDILTKSLTVLLKEQLENTTDKSNGIFNLESIILSYFNYDNINVNW